MPDAQRVRRVAAARYDRALEDWVGRLKEWGPYSVPTGAVLALVRIEGPHDEGAPVDPGPIGQAIQHLLKVRVARHLGEAEYVVALLHEPDQNQLALTGALCVTRASYRISAL
jgi:hypothetical protein